MAHVREGIVAAAQTLATGLTTTGSNVFRDRDTDERPLQSDELPGLVLEDDGDPSEILSIGVTRLLERRMRIGFTAHVKADSGYSTLLNTILKELEVAIGGASSIGGAKYGTLILVGPREVSEAGDKPTVRQVFTFEFFYITAHGAPETAL